MEYNLLALLEDLHAGAYFVDRDNQILFWNQAAERLTGYSVEEALGQNCEDLLAHVDDEGTPLCGQRCPMIRVMEDAYSREVEVHYRHRGGHRIPTSVRAAPLRNPSGEIVGCAQLFTDFSDRRAIALRVRELETLSLIDPLTRLSNRTHLEAEIESRLQEQRRYGLAFGVLFFDLDQFRDFNYRYGHGMGDRMLSALAETLKSSARSFDVFGRWGGDEFIGILRNIGPEDLACIASRCRALIEKTTVANLQVRVSAGATLAHPEDTLDSLVHRAEGMMMLSKEKGGNQVSIDAE